MAASSRLIVPHTLTATHGGRELDRAQRRANDGDHAYQSTDHKGQHRSKSEMGKLPNQVQDKVQNLSPNLEHNITYARRNLEKISEKSLAVR